LFAEEFQPRVLVMENARELLRGNFAHHFENLKYALETLGYRVHAESHLLNRFGLPQIRERALVVAAANDVEIHTLDELWEGFGVAPEATSVRRAIGHLPFLEAGQVDPSDSAHACPAFTTDSVLERLQSIPHDGGSWRELWSVDELRYLLTPSMRRNAESGKLGSHPDVYGRMWWDRPAPTIKRECGHIGNGRYAHPHQDRLLSLREMALVNGFPETYQFGGGSLANRYRHVGDAVPPLISHQLAWLTQWMLGGDKPPVHAIVLPGTSLRATDIVEVPRRAIEAA
jgi:DNA (cytosine-5)-methyltransferase 1